MFKRVLRVILKEPPNPKAKISLGVFFLSTKFRCTTVGVIWIETLSLNLRAKI